MKTDFLKYYSDYINPKSILEAELITVSDLDIPSNSNGINREGYTYGQLKKSPIIPELYSIISNPKVRNYIDLCNQRNSDKDFLMYKVNGEYCFWNFRIGPVVALPDESLLREIISKNTFTSDLLSNKSLTARTIRDISYQILQNKIALDCGVSFMEAKNIIGNVLDCAPHEDISGYIFMVPNWAHSWFRHKGYVSKMIETLNS